MMKRSIGRSGIGPATLVSVVLLVLTANSCDPVNMAHLFEPSNWISVKSDESTKYFSFSSASEVNPAVQSWDVAFTYDRLIYTNSGSSATGVSGGQGAVDFSGSDQWDTVTSSSAADFSGTNNHDTTYYVSGHIFGPSAEPRVMNVMTYIGYSHGDGSFGNPFTQDGYLYNQEQFYRAEGITLGPPTYIMTNRVYFIKSGDGSKTYKFQVLMDTLTNERDWGFRFELLP